MNVDVAATFDYQESIYSHESVGVKNWHEVFDLFSRDEVKKQVAAVHEAQAKRAEKEKAEAKKKLPAIIFGGTMNGKSRSNANITPSAFHVLDLDHLADDPGQVWLKHQDKAKEAGVVMAYISPSGTGLKIIFVRKLSDIAADQFRVFYTLGFNDLGMTTLDAACKDPSRCSFVSTVDDILYFDPEPAATPPIPSLEEVPAPAAVPDSEVTPPAQAGPSPVATGSFPTDIEGVPLTAVAGQWLKTRFGSEIPPIGMRHTQLIAAAAALRWITDFNPAWLAQILPANGLPEDELKKICEDQCALSTEGITQMPLSVREAIDDVKHTPGLPVWWEDVSLPPLPPGLQELVESCPEGYRDSVVLASLPCLGTLGTGVRAYSSKTHEDDEGEVQTPTFFTTIEAPQAGGKSVIKRVVELLMAPLLKKDKEFEEKELEWRNELDRLSKVAKAKPPKPAGAKRIISPSISKKELYIRQHAVGEKHLLKFTTELSSVVGYRKRGDWADFTSDDKLAFHNEVSGQDHASSDAFNVSVRLFYNILYLATPGVRREFLRNTEDGTVTRYILDAIPDELGAPEPRCKKLSDDAQAKLHQLCQTLMDISEKGEVWYDLPFLDLEREAWVTKMGTIAKQTQNYALDTARKRSAVVGFRAGMLIAACWNPEGNWTDEQRGYIIQFFHYVANHMLAGIMMRYEKELQTPYSVPTPARRVPHVQLYNALPQEFTIDQLSPLAQQYGIARAAAKIAYDWKAAGVLQSIGHGRYKKQMPTSA